MRENINLATEYIKDSPQLNGLRRWSDFMEGFNTKSSTIHIKMDVTERFYSLINNVISEEAYDMFSEEAYNAWGYLGKFESENNISDIEEKLAFALIRMKVEKYFNLKEINGSLHIVRILE